MKALRQCISQHDNVVYSPSITLQSCCLLPSAKKDPRAGRDPARHGAILQLRCPRCLAAESNDCSSCIYTEEKPSSPFPAQSPAHIPWAGGTAGLNEPYLQKGLVANKSQDFINFQSLFSSVLLSPTTKIKQSLVLPLC